MAVYMGPMGSLKHNAHSAPPSSGLRSIIARLVTTVTGLALIVYGVIAAVSPLPLGVPLIVVGFLMIAMANPAARPLIRHMRRKWRWFDFIVRQVEDKSPERLKETIEETDPEEDEAG